VGGKVWHETRESSGSGGRMGVVTRTARGRRMAVEWEEIQRAIG
jgi:hypothetical protein